MGSVVKRLQRVRASNDLVRVQRTVCGRERLDGYVVDVGARWALLAMLDDRIVLDGFTAVSIADIIRVKRAGTREFVERALRLHGEWPPRAPAESIPLGDMRELVRFAAQQDPMITIHIEHRDPDVCFIGVPVKFGRRYLHLREATPNAEWWDRIWKWAWSDISRVDFGDRYARTLHEVAGAPPSGPLRPPRRG